MLGLFTVPPEAKIKGKEERQLETLLLREGREFFGGADDGAVKDGN